jgi:H+/Cl- antiporter ClcA
MYRSIGLTETIWANSFFDLIGFCVAGIIGGLIGRDDR